MDRWRLLVPATMVECDYVKEEAVAMAKESLETVYPQKVAVAVPPDPTGEAGLDRALAEDSAKRVERRGKEKKRGKASSDSEN